MRNSRHLALWIAILVTIVCAIGAFRTPSLLLVATPFAILATIGVRDLRQTRHSVRRNYPIVGHLRWIFERFRPELRQYLMETDHDGRPFSRRQRSLIYARAKGETSDGAFGTLEDVYSVGHEFIGHSTMAVEPADPKTFRIDIGGPDCLSPYSASIMNISAMSFGSLSANAIRALNKGAAKGGFAHDTGEGAISQHHREFGGDLIWEIGSGYFGCRTQTGDFDPDLFAQKASLEQVRMIEIKLSQGAKPGHGGILPSAKITKEISETRNVPMGRDCVSPASHSAFSTPLGLIQFIRRLRDLSGGKPIGFKLCVGQPFEFMAIVKAMLETRTYPDFIVVDGSEGGTGAAPLEFSDHLGMPLREGLLFVHNTLVGAGIRDIIKIGASGKITSAFDIAATLALGADWVNSARGFMFALGCIQSLSCSTNHCPTGIATQDPDRQKALHVPDKGDRVARFHANTMRALSDMMASAGLERPKDIRPSHLNRRISSTEVRMFSQLHVFLEEGELLGADGARDFYGSAWRTASSDSFRPSTPDR